mgnify:CR=1 FL=1
MSLWNSMVNMSPTGKVATSLILKDAVGCYLYVNQARTNKKMTPQQRADVANYDLANGVINIGLQLLAVKPIENTMKKVINSKVMKHFFKDLDKRLASTDDKMVTKLLKNKTRLTEGAVALLSVGICQYFIKRCVSPFFSVPAGDKSKEWGLIKPKMYPGETFEKEADKKIELPDKLEGVEFVRSQKPENEIKSDKVSFSNSPENTDTNLLSKFKK